MDINSISSLITIIGFPVAILGIILAIISHKTSAKVEQGRFLLQLRSMFLEHEYVHLKLRNVNNWIPRDEDWAKIDSYLGLFEVCEILISNGSLKLDHFVSQYKYRIDNLLKNDAIKRCKIDNLNEDWSKLNALIRRL